MHVSSGRPGYVAPPAGGRVPMIVRNITGGPAAWPMACGAVGVVSMGRTRGLARPQPAVARNASGQQLTIPTRHQATAAKRGRARVPRAMFRPAVVVRVNMTTWVVVPGIIAQARRVRKSYGNIRLYLGKVALFA